MSYRQTTPPSANFYMPGSVGSSDGAFYSNDSSPDSVITANTTPPRSPIRQHGPMLLPKVRTQDQIAEPTGGPVRHRRTTSSNSIGYTSYNPYSRPGSMIRRGSSPFNYSSATASTLTSPCSTASYDFGHTRATSVGSIDESVVSRFGFPTYRNLPSYVTSSAAPSSLNVVTSIQDIPSFTTTTTTTADFSLPEFESAPAVQYPLDLDLNFDTFNPTPTSSLLDYLTAPNPSPALVRRVQSIVGRGQHNHFWWDVRNLRSWTDFNINTITALPSIPELLQVPVPSNYLPEPSRALNLQPENESQLHDIYTSYYTPKLNAALKVALGEAHMSMKSLKPAVGIRPQPEFVSNYPSDYEKTIYGDSRGRVVGLVKCYDQWNTGMRGESPPKQVLYLQGLAHLHRVMREHGCRYGFIITEIELLCVRCGGPSSAATPDPTTFNTQTGIPIFGYLETSPPIRLSTHGLHPETGAIQMTAGLALWYLHMLAKENPFEGMGTWRMEVGGPAALTRQNFLERDSWVPKPNLSEKRDAKRVRGWVWPEEPLSKRECGKGKRGKSVG
ncbi:hypothetical protein CC78DRAFT_519574 [Lojkania enalia]|uniref:Sialidase n=1 Tax=Lojkania enalia TaxID=147567 RepID=A0A9P4KB34_9PLEO|nr:hypothetical protein CC78DRAFT_519574 [Didymosphaeria enalia]